MGILGDIGRSNVGQAGQTIFGDIMKYRQMENQDAAQILTAQHQEKQMAILEAEAARKAAEYNDAHQVEDINQFRKMYEDQGQGGVFKVMYERAIPYIHKDANGKEVILKKDRQQVVQDLYKDPHYRFRAGTAKLDALQSQSDEYGAKFTSLKEKLDSNPDATLEEQTKWSTEAQAASDAKKKLDAEITKGRTALYWSDPEFAKVMLAAQNKGVETANVTGPDGKPVIVPKSMSVGMTPYVKDSQSALQEVTTTITELSGKSNLTPEESKRLKSAQLFVQLSQQSGMTNPVPIYDEKGKFTGLAGVVNKGGQMTTTYMPVAVPSGSTAGPKPGAPSDAAVTTANQLGQVINDIKNAHAYYKPGYVGFVRGPLGEAQDKTGVGADENRAIFNSSLKGMKAVVVYLRTGKQINETEIKNLEKEVPTGGESDPAYKGKFKRFVSQLDRITGLLYDHYKGAGDTNIGELEKMRDEMKQLSKQFGLKGTGSALPKGIPVGSKLYGKSKGGKDVYQTPAGKFFEVD